MESNKLVVTSWVLIEPAEDIPGAWVAHSLDFDVISYGDSPQDAIDCICEAVAMTVTDDLSDGRDPHARKPAPEKYWDRLLQVLRHGAVVKIAEVVRPSMLALPITLAFQRVSRDHETAVDMMLNQPAPTGYVEQQLAA